jgi:hypothetical protein
VSGQNYPEDIPLLSINYEDYQPPSGSTPEYLISFTESLSGNIVTRISDSQVFGTTSSNLRHNYSSDQPWNSDGSLIKLAGYPAAILDGKTYEFKYWTSLPSTGKWSNTQPNIIYGTGGKRFVSHNVVTNDATTLRSFDDYSSIDFGYGEGNFSDDDRYVGLIGSNNNERTLIVYDILNNQIVGTRYLGSSGDLDWFSVSPSGNFAVVSWRPDGSGQNEGVKVYDINLTNERHISDYSSHSDMGYDSNGIEIILSFGDDDVWNNGFYLRSTRLDNGESQGLYNYPGGIWGGHISMRNINRPGWAYISEGCCTDHPVASREIFAIKLDGSNTIERFAKHHTDSDTGYGHQAHAVPNRDGTGVMFASNWDNAFSGNNAPAFIVEAPQNTTTDTVTANAGNDVAICEGNTTILTASGGASYLWSTGETTQSINVGPNTTTTYSVTVSNATTSDTDSVTVTVNAVPISNAGNDVTIEQGQSATLTASGGDTYEWSNGSTSQSISVSPNTTTTYSVTVYENGCSSTDDVIVTVVTSTGSVTANAGNDVAICEGNNTTLTASGGASYLWSTGETTQSINVGPNTTTTYSVTVSNATTSDTDSVTVTVNAIPISNAGNDVTIEQGQSATLTASGGDTYEWSNGSTSQNITVSPNTATTYSVTVYENGCFSTDYVEVIVIDPVIASAGENVSICKGQSVVLSASGGIEYYWNTGDTTQSITVIPNHTTVYSVSVSNGLTTETAKVIVTVNQCSPPSLDLDEDNTSIVEFKVYPNPTHDIINIKLTGLYEVSSIQLYDILGKILINEVIQPSGNQSSPKTMNLSAFPRGVYLLTIIQGGMPFTKKIILN